MSFFRLKDLIRAVRVCKTAADERSVIQRESAAIRTSFKEADTHDARYVNIQKLLYIYLLGFPVQFGQLECLKLAASTRFSDKRVGYLGVTLLLDEKQEILTLLTNSLKSDMHSADDYIVGLALCTLANVGSAAVANDLVDEVERLLGSARSYVRKKAALAAVRVVRREPELASTFVGRTRALLGDKHHGVQLAGAALAGELCVHSQEALDEGRRLVPVVVRQVRALLGTASPEHEVGGINDPFLLAALLRLLCVVARGSQEAADAANDVLTQVATQVGGGSGSGGGKNVATAILYECCVTVLGVPSAQALRVLAINQLGAFLAHADNNVRYVALATLATAVISEAPAVQRHRATVVQCMADPDSSIRRRAVDLGFALINAQNVHPMVDAILRVLPQADADLKPSMVHRLAAAIALFGEDTAWRVERMLRVLHVAGAHLASRDLHKFLRLVAGGNEDVPVDDALRRRTVRQCFALLQRDVSQDKMVVAGVWMVGEYADLLVAGEQQQQQQQQQQKQGAVGVDAEGLDILGALGRPVENKTPTMATSGALVSLDEELPQATPTPAEVARLLATLARTPAVSRTAQHMALTALAKLAGRTADPAALSCIQQALATHTRSMDSETQARAAEFQVLLGESSLGSVLQGVVERMPVPEYPDVAYEEYVLNPAAMRMKALTVIRRPALRPEDLDAPPASAEDAAAAATAGEAASKQAVVSDLLGLMDDVQPVSPVTATSPPAATTTALADLLSATTLTPTLAAAQSTQPAGLDTPYEAYNDAQGLRITLTPSKLPATASSSEHSTPLDILVTFANTGDCAVESLALLVAVPKSQTLQMAAPSAQNIACGMSATQIVRVANPTRAPVRLRMKLSYVADGRQHQTMFDFSGFPSTVV